jgi:hypothetical protein
MPDKYGFDHLGDGVRCIEPGCVAGGRRGQWPDERREAHRREAHPEEPTVIHQRRENRIMSKTSNRVSGRQACVAAIRAAGRPLSASETAAMVVDAGVVEGLKGKTPKATLSAQITSGAKNGATFRRVGETKPALFDVLDGVPESPGGLVEALKAHLAPADKPAGQKKPVAGKDVTPDPKPSTRKRAKATA